jgi:sigma-B regulation protein RsbU (phosphoserine phosphatase)
MTEPFLVRKVLDLYATPGEVMRGVEAIQELAAAHGAPEKIIFNLALALEECGINIVNHALKRDAQRKFEVVFEHTGDSFAIQLRDDGPEFDPTAPPPRKPQAEDDDPPGGWGIELVRRNMNEIHYVRDGNENVLRLTKRVSLSAD